MIPYLTLHKIPWKIILRTLSNVKYTSSFLLQLNVFSNKFERQNYVCMCVYICMFIDNFKHVYNECGPFYLPPTTLPCLPLIAFFFPTSPQLWCLVFLVGWLVGFLTHSDQFWLLAWTWVRSYMWNMGKLSEATPLK